MKRSIRRYLIITVAIAIIFVITTSPYYLPSQQQTANPKFEPESQIIGHIHSLYVDSVNANLMLLGTHEALFRSNDKGNTWIAVKVGSDEPRDFMAIISDATKKPNILYAIGHGMFVVKSVDGGNTWRTIEQGLTSSDIHAIAIARNDPNMLYVWVVDNGLFRSKNGGASWERINDGPPNSNVLALASVNISTGMGGIYLYAGTSGGLYRSADCFCGWSKVSNLFDSKTIFSLAVSPTNPSIMFTSTSAGVYRSDDEGANWKKVGNGLEGVDAIALTFDVSDPSYIYAVNNIGVVYYSNNLGESWTRFK
ncbi:MAG: YCF48-related protein [Thaumarchaeota archaeon]|nr:YCF48-related protein [Nitrososphaerota archaeon]